MAVEVNGGDGFDATISHVTEATGYNYAWTAASQYGGFVRGTYAPGEGEQRRRDFGRQLHGLLVDTDGDGLANDLGQFYSCSRLYENFDDAHSQQSEIGEHLRTRFCGRHLHAGDRKPKLALRVRHVGGRHPPLLGRAGASRGF